ncbi:MAG: hypothetical protein MUO61_04540 [Dehalococcoidia bacterium]|nr:hypothetical protein [Dehalococcoidia bacterium]
MTVENSLMNQATTKVWGERLPKCPKLNGKSELNSLTVNKGCAAIRRGQLMAKTFRIALVPVLIRAMLGGARLTM